MAKTFFTAAALFILAVASTRFCFGDEVTDDMVSAPAMAVTIKSLGVLAFAGKGDAKDLEHDKAELKKTYFAFMPDVHFSDARLAQETQRFDAAWASLVDVSREFDVTQVAFIGCDTLGLVKCTDMYYLSVTSKGPVLFRFSMEFDVNDKARFFGVETYSDWNKVKEVTRSIQHLVSPMRVPTVTYHPHEKPTTAGTS